MPAWRIVERHGERVVEVVGEIVPVDRQLLAEDRACFIKGREEMVQAEKVRIYLEREKMDGADIDVIVQELAELRVALHEVMSRAYHARAARAEYDRDMEG